MDILAVAPRKTLNDTLCFKKDTNIISLSYLFSQTHLFVP